MFVKVRFEGQLVIGKVINNGFDREEMLAAELLVQQDIPARCCLPRSVLQIPLCTCCTVVSLDIGVSPGFLPASSYTRYNTGKLLGKHQMGCVMELIC